MTYSPEKGVHTSEVILEAAYHLFLEQGYHGTSMRQIAQRAGLALGGIYNHYNSKEHIFESVLLQKHPYRLMLDVLLAAPGDSLENFARNATSTITSELGKRPDFLKLAFIELSEFKGKHVSSLSQIIFPEIYPLFQRFKESEHDLRDIPIQTIFLSFLGTLISYFMISNLVTPGTVYGLDEISLEPFIDIFLHGVLKPPQSQPGIPTFTPEPGRKE